MCDQYTKQTCDKCGDVDSSVTLIDKYRFCEECYNEEERLYA